MSVSTSSESIYRVVALSTRPQPLSLATRLSKAVFDNVVLPFLTQKEIHELRRSHYSGISFQASVQGMALQNTVTVKGIRHYEKVMGKESFKSNKLTHLVVDDVQTTKIELISLIRRCPNIIHLDLSNCRNITDATLRTLTQMLPNLETLNISRNRVESDDLRYAGCISDIGIHAIATNCKKLKNLNISIRKSSNEITPLGIRELVTNCKELQSLEMRHFDNSDNSWLDDIATIGLKLIALDVSGCTGVTNDKLNKILKDCPNLERLSVTSNQVSNAMFDNIEHCLNLKHIHLESWNTNDQTLAILARICPKLESIDISNTREISKEGIASLAQFTNLQVLKICRIAIPLEEIAKYCPNLRNLIAVGCREVTDAGLKTLGKACPKLQEIDVSLAGHFYEGNVPRTNLTYEGIVAFEKLYPKVKVTHTTVPTIPRAKAAPKKGARSRQKLASQVSEKRPSVLRDVMEHPATHAAISALFANYMGFWPGVLLFAGMQSASYAMRSWMKLR